MKKILLSFSLLLFFCFSYAQSFRFNPDGSAATVTFKAGKKTVHQLFEETMAWVSKNYNSYSFNDIIAARQPDKSITLNLFTDNAIIDQTSESKKWLGKKGYPAKCELAIEFHNNGYTIHFQHLKFYDFKNQINNEASFTLREVLAASGGTADYDTDILRWKGAKEHYERLVNDLYSRLNKYLTTGELVPDDNPYIVDGPIPFSQEISFNADGTIEPVTYKVDKTAMQMYYETWQWMNKQFISPVYVIKELHKNESITISSSFGGVLYPNIPRTTTQDNLGCSGNFEMKIEFQDGQYSISYKHLYFTGVFQEKINVDFNELLANTKITEAGNGKDLKWQGVRPYEKRVNQFLTSLNNSLTTSELSAQ